MKLYNSVKHLTYSLQSMEVTSIKNELCMAVLNGLPPRSEKFVAAFEALGNEDKLFTFRHEKRRLVQEKQRSKTRDDKSGKAGDLPFLLGGGGKSYLGLNSGSRRLNRLKRTNEQTVVAKGIQKIVVAVMM